MKLYGGENTLLIPSNLEYMKWCEYEIELNFYTLKQWYSVVEFDWNMIDMSRKQYICFIVFIFISCKQIAAAFGEGYEFGKKLPVTPFKVLDKFGQQMCFTKCESYGVCLSINYNRKHLVCELNSEWKNSTLSLINDGDYVYKEIPSPVSNYYLNTVNQLFFCDFLHIHWFYLR